MRQRAGPMTRACGGPGEPGALGAARLAGDRLRAGARPPTAEPTATGAPAQHARQGGKGGAHRKPTRGRASARGNLRGSEQLVQDFDIGLRGDWPPFKVCGVCTGEFAGAHEAVLSQEIGSPGEGRPGRCRAQGTQFNE